MMGLVIATDRRTLAGLTPLSDVQVRLTKAVEWLRGTWPALLLLAAPLPLVAVGVVFGFVISTAPFPWIDMLFGSMVAGIGVAGFVGILRIFLAHLPRWASTPVQHDEAGSTMFWRDEVGHASLLPIPVQAIASRMEAMGLTPHVEYFDDDPFLFVELGGRRIYLAHWR